MKILNFQIGGRKTPSQTQLGKTSNMIGSFFGLGYQIDEFDLYSQVKDYRTDLLNGTNWRPTTEQAFMSFEYIQFLDLLSKYSTSIYNDWNKWGYAILAKIDGQIFYVSPNNYTKSDRKVTINGYPQAQVFIFDEPNAFCGEKTIFQKCEPYQRLYNIALSCQKNGMSKSGYVNVISPRTPSGSSVMASLDDDTILEMEKRVSESHGIANSSQTNMLFLKKEVDIRTINYDFGKLGILETKKLCEEFVCSKLGVPFVLLPSSGQTFTNYEQANKILYENHSKYCEFFCKFVRRELKLDIDYKTIAEAGKGII